MKKQLYIYCLLICLCIPMSVYAMYGNSAVRNITMDNGLPSNAVRSIVQDKHGFVWFGTDMGLCRYDGYEVHTFYIPQISSDQYVSCLCPIADGMLVGTINGVYVFSFRSETFTRMCTGIHGLISSFAVDGDDNIWVSTTEHGVYRYSRHSHKCKNYPFKIFGGNISDVFVDNNNQVLCLTNSKHNGLYKLNKSSDIFRAVDVKGASVLLNGMKMIQGPDNSLYIGTWENGVVQLHSDGTTTQLISPKLSNVGLHIHSLLSYSQDLLLIGCDDGLIEYNIPQRKWRKVSAKDNSSATAAEKFVYAITKDGEDGMWIGTFYGGVSYFSPIGERFVAYRSDEHIGMSGNVTGRFCEDAKHRIWIATDDGGLNCYDAVNNRFINFPGCAEMNKLNVHGLYMDGNELWVGTYTDGIIKMNVNTGVKKVYQFDGLANSSCYALLRDRNKRLWATSMDAVYLYDEKTGRFDKVKAVRSMTIDIEQDKSGNLWFATQGGGLFRYSNHGKNWKQYLPITDDTTSLGSNQINCVRVGCGGNLYVGTNNGLFVYRPQTDNFKRVPLDTPDVDIACIIPNQDEMWLSGSNGITRYIPGGRVQAFNKYDGLVSEPFQPNSGYMASDGRIYFGSTCGFNAFYPYQIKVNKTLAPVFITKLEIFNQEVNVGNDKLKEALSQIDKLDLSYKDDMFSFSFASLSYISPEKNQYAYMLEGFDKDWIYCGAQHKATYTNIPAGDYVFRVKATNNDGIWNTHEARLKIEVHPPFWWSLPAKIFYLLLVGYLIYLYTHIKLYRAENKHRQELKELNARKEQEVREARLQFFTMIAHEIRTPVTLIIGPLESLKDEWLHINKGVKNTSTISSTIDVIDRNAQRLLNLVNQLLDFNKVQQSGMQVRFKLQNISRLLHAVTERFAPTLKQKSIILHTVYPPDDFSAVIDYEAVTKVISNLMANATKYARNNVKLSCVVGVGSFCIEVEDDGEGIGEDDREKIFNPFFQAKDNKPGTGIGLSIVKKLVEAHNGTVKVKSVVGKGSVFTVTLPINQKNVAIGDERIVESADERLKVNAESEDVSVEENVNGQATMLIVEDDEDMRNFLVANFKSGYKVLTAVNGVEGLRQLDMNVVTLIVSDWMMPEMDGAEFCKRVRADKNTSHIPFVMLTAKTDNDSKTEGMNCGADAYIEKPFSMKYLEACIRNMIEMRRRLQQKFSSVPLEPITEIASTDVDNDFLVKMNRLIEDNLDNQDMSVAFIAEKLSISRSTLFSKIKVLADVTPNEMIQLVRLKKAARLLKENKYRVNDVCYMVGFSSPSYFAKCFQKQFGVKPGEFCL